MTPKPHQLPLALRKRPQWVGWRYQTRHGKQTKVPIDAKTGRNAKSNDRSTWSDFETALAAVEKYHLAGVGYVFSADDPFTGIDLDDCRDATTGEIAPWAQEIIDAFPTYWEVSPSGTGVKGWIEGAL
jgi:putative DNA primase/helicase